MNAFFMKLLMRLTRHVGPWFLRSTAWFVTLGHFVFCPGRVKASMDLYRLVFPDQGSLFYRLCAWRQFQDFAASYCDRLALEAGGNIVYRDEGWNRLEEALQAGLGAILLVSHLGNWEIAARLFRRKGLKMLLLMGERDPKAVSRLQKADMEAEGLRLHVSPPGEGSPLGGLEMLEFLRRGGVVAVAGDLAWTEQRRRVKVRLFDRPVILPAAPHLLALLSGAPLIPFFSFREGRGLYRYVIGEAQWIKASSAAERNQAVLRSAKWYASLLEDAVRSHPWQWHIFEPLRGPASGPE